MPNPTSSALFEHLKELLDEADAHRREPALKPIQLARRLLNAAAPIISDDVEAILRSFRGSLCDYYLLGADDVGWLRVPAPRIDAMSDWIAEYMATAQTFGKRVLLRRDVQPIARYFAAVALDIWPIMPYFTLDLLVDAVAAEQELPTRFLHSIGIEWTKEGAKSRPSLVKIEPTEQDFYERLWLEAATMLASEAPSEFIERLLQGKVKAFTQGRLFVGSELLHGRRRLVEVRLPQAEPFRGIAYVNQVLRNEAAARLILESAPEGAKLATLRRYWAQGLSRNATAVQITQHAELKAQKRAHRADGYRTKRQLAELLKTSLRQVENALVEVEERLGKQRPARDGVLRLDPAWCGLVKEIIKKQKKEKKKSR